MKVNSVKIEQLFSIYSHPSAAFFRANELRVIYKNCREVEFKHPSLDLGCGDGKIAGLLFDSPFTYGVDNNESDDVQAAVSSKVYSRVFIESAEKMSLPSEHVNFVFSNSVIEHIPNNEKVLSEVSRITRKRGRFIFTVPSHLFSDYLFLSNKLSRMGLNFLADLYKTKRNQKLNHFHCYSHKEWRDRLEKYRFRIIKSEYYLSRKSLMLWDKIAWEVYLKKHINPNAERKVLKKYQEVLLSCLDEGSVTGVKGAALFVHCIKE